MTDGIARAMSAGCQSPLAPSDEGAVTEGDWGRERRLSDFLRFCLSLCLAYARHLSSARPSVRTGVPRQREAMSHYLCHPTP